LFFSTQCKQQSYRGGQTSPDSKSKPFNYKLSGDFWPPLYSRTIKFTNCGVAGGRQPEVATPGAGLGEGGGGAANTLKSN